MTPTSPTSPSSVITLYKKLLNVVGLTVTHLTVLSVFLVTIFGLIQLTTINTYAQAAGEVNTIGSIGFKECNFVSNSQTKGATVVGDVDSQFQKCIGSVIQFFFALALFIIAVRIAIEAFSNVNPMEAGKAVSSTITLVRDVTVGLLLIGSPGIFLSFFNPTTLSLAGIVNLQYLSGNKKAEVDSKGNPIPKTGEGGVPLPTQITYDKITPEQAAELVKDPEALNKFGLNPSTIRENFLRDLKAGKVDWKDPKNVSLMKFFKAQSGDSVNEILNQVYPSVKLDPQSPYFNNALLGSRALPLSPFTLTATDKYQDISGGQKRRDYKIGCPADTSSATELFKEMCGKTVGLITDDCAGKPYINSSSIPTSTGTIDKCLLSGVLRNTDNIK